MTDDFDGIGFMGYLNRDTGTVHKRLDCPSVARSRRQSLWLNNWIIGTGQAERICHTCARPSAQMIEHKEAVARYNKLKEGTK